MFARTDTSSITTLAGTFGSFAAMVALAMSMAPTVMQLM